MNATSPAIDYEKQRFRTSEVAAAAGIPAVNVRSHFFHKRWRQIGRPAEADGMPNLFSLRDAMTFALAAKLMSLGVRAADAFESAVRFVYASPQGERNPGKLFDIREKGLTVFVYWPASKAAKVIAEDDVKSLSDLTVSGRCPGVEEGTIVLVLNYLQDRVFHALNIAGSAEQ